MKELIEKLTRRQKQLADSQRNQLAQVLMIERELEAAKGALAAIEGAKSEVDRVLNEVLVAKESTPTG